MQGRNDVFIYQDLNFLIQIQYKKQAEIFRTVFKTKMNDFTKWMGNAFQNVG
jgi:hypothetical protein